MAYVTKIDDRTRLVYNSDLSGLYVEQDRDAGEAIRIDIPREALFSVVAWYVRGDRIGRIEDMGDEEILGLC